MRTVCAVLLLAASSGALLYAQRRPAPAKIVETPKPEPAVAAARWRLQYFYDKAESTLSIFDLKFPSAQRGVALGALNQRGKEKPALLVTNNGGEKWDFVPMEENGLSLFFLDEKHGWLVTDKGLWKTEEAGRTWRKLTSWKGILRVSFLSPTHGFAVGHPKSILETDDGGKHWKKVAEAAQPNSKPEYTTYSVIDFLDGNFGLITGISKPPRRDLPLNPAWMDPDGGKSRLQVPNLMMLLQTVNGGKSWHASTSSMFGTVTRTSLGANRSGLLLLEFFDAFDFASEVHRLDLSGDSNSVVFRRKDRAVTDVAIQSSGTAYLAAIEPPGLIYHSPIPGKLHILRSTGRFDLWEEMQVDYRANGTRAVLASAGPGHVWAATDTGMILKLAE